MRFPPSTVYCSDAELDLLFAFLVGNRDRPISPGSPWQNGCAERLIGTLRRECLDRMLIFGEMHVRRILSAYAAYYKQARTHLALQKDAPLHRAVQRPGAIVVIPILAGLHHQLRPDMIFRKGHPSSARPEGIHFYYNAARTHLGLQKDAPHRRPIERRGRIVTSDVLGGLHHQYCRM